MKYLLFHLKIKNLKRKLQDIELKLQKLHIVEIHD